MSRWRPEYPPHANGPAGKQATPIRRPLLFPLRTDPARPGQEARGPAPALPLHGRELERLTALCHMCRGADEDVTDFLELVRKKKYLLSGIDFDSAPPLLGGVDGNRALSREEAVTLRGEYDTSNLPSQRQYALFQKLAELEVLSVSDVRQTQFSVAPGRGDLMGYLLVETQFSDVTLSPETRPKERLGLMIRNERFASRHVLSRYGQRCGAVDRLADSHQKVLDTLRRI